MSVSFSLCLLLYYVVLRVLNQVLLTALGLHPRKIPSAINNGSFSNSLLTMFSYTSRSLIGVGKRRMVRIRLHLQFLR